jgi:holin-like protein
MILESVLGFLLLTAFFLLGDLLHRLGAPIPGGVLGLLLLYLALHTKILKMKWVDRTAGAMLRHMVLLFVPLTVGLMEVGPVLGQHAWAIAASLLVSWTAVVLTTGLLGHWLLPAPPATEIAQEEETAP